MKQFILIIPGIIFSLILKAQTGNLYQTIEENIKQNFIATHNYSVYSNIFELSKKPEDYSDSAKLKQYSIFNINNDVLVHLLNERPNLLVLKIPQLNSDSIELKLVRYNLFPEGLKAVTYPENKEIDLSENLKNSLFYRGVSSKDKNSWCAVSIFEDDLNIVIATNDGNYNFGKILKSPKYVLYNDRNRVEPGKFECGTSEKNQNDDVIFEANNTSESNCPVTLRWLMDYDFYYTCVYYNGWNDNQIAQYVMALFNNVSALYQNENIVLSLNNSSIGWWNQPDGFSDTDSQNAFLSFGYWVHNNYPEFTENLAMFIALNNNGNGASVGVIDAFCTSYYYNPNDLSNPNNPSGRFAYSRIDNYYYDYPTYSNTIAIISHEMGHNFGSRHTHWCGWPGGPIDGCTSYMNPPQSPEPDNNGFSCNPGPLPGAENATVMSYCALQ